MRPFCRHSFIIIIIIVFVVIVVVGHFKSLKPQKQRFSSFENNTGQTDGRTDRRTDATSYRDAWSHLKIAECCENKRSLFWSFTFVCLKQGASKFDEGRVGALRWDYFAGWFGAHRRRTFPVDTPLPFLDATKHLYKRSCPSIRRSVRRSVRP